MQNIQIINRIRAKLTRKLFSIACILALIATGCSHSRPTPIAKTWNRKAAAAYLDERERQWSEWPGATRDQGTFCISCHTSLPYALARPVLEKALLEPKPSVEENVLVDDVVKRVRLWNRIGPYYSDKDMGAYKTTESRGTESVLNALILANHDAQQTNYETRVAFDHMWEMQETSGQLQGSWPWLQFGHQEPWEADDSQFFGACLAAVAVGIEPAEYRASVNIQYHLQLLREYLNREYSQQSEMNRIALLWASAKLPGLLNSRQQQALVDEILKKQRADGGWQLAPLTWKWKKWSLASFVRMWLRPDGTVAPQDSDGLATAMLAFVLLQAGVPANNTQLQRALSWLARNQTEQGDWLSSSPNKRRRLASNSGHFMSDAATGYAVLALMDSHTENQLAANGHSYHNLKSATVSH